MSDIQLITDRAVYRHELKEPLYYMHEGQQVVAVEVFVESDFYHHDQFAVQTVEANGNTKVYRSDEIAKWPQPIRRLYRAHQRELRETMIRHLKGKQ